MDLIEINDQIYLSAEFEDSDVSYIKSCGFDAVLDLRAEDTDNEQLIRKLGMDFFHVDIVDHENPTFKHLEDVLSFTDPILDSGKKLLIHCRAGTGRAPLIAITILAHRGMKLPDAIDFVESNHPNLGFSEVQIDFMKADLVRFFTS